MTVVTGIRQVGYSNSASAVLNWSSSDNKVGGSQDGNGHYADITTIGNENVVLAIQHNDGFTASIGNSMTVSITGNANNGLNGVAAAAFSGIALAAAQLAPTIDRAVLIAPDATVLVSSLQGTIGLVPGLLVQLGGNNTMNIDVGSKSLSNDNLFAAIQKGDRNSFSATVNGNANQFLVSQIGDDNVAAVNQLGNGNIAVISQ